MAALARLRGLAGSFLQFPLSLRRFLAGPLPPAVARERLAARLADRPRRLLTLFERGVYGRPANPYRALLAHAGCELGDVRRLVADDGVEGALGRLRAAGVYVTYEELKGRRAIERGSLRLETAPSEFDNPAARRELAMTTSGSTGLANVVYQDLDHIAELAENELLALDAHGAAAAPTVHWTHILPGSGIRYVLERARHGQRRQLWFTPLAWGGTRASWKHDPATRYMLACLRLRGVHVGRPAFVPPAEAATVARAVRAALDGEGRCLLRTTVSLGLRVCLAAEAAGFDLHGATIRVASEPLTAAQRERMEAAGAHVIAGYGSVETGAIATGCLLPSHADEVHLQLDAYAMIDHPHAVAPGEPPVPAFNLTNLRESSPKLLLNYQIDDCGAIERRACGCPLEALGWDLHLHSIRSYTKLVFEGATLVGSELLALVEEELPRRFGGSPLDYQLQARADAAGLARLVLVVSPRVPEASPAAIERHLLERLRAASPMGDAAGSIWRHARALRVERGEPELGARGKHLPLLRRAAPP